MSKRNNKRTGWHREDIKAAIRKRGETLVSLARKDGLSETCVRNALRTPLPSGERAISTFLGVPLHELWPDRWTPKGDRIRPRYANKYLAIVQG